MIAARPKSRRIEIPAPKCGPNAAFLWNQRLECSCHSFSSSPSSRQPSSKSVFVRRVFVCSPTFLRSRVGWFSAAFGPKIILRGWDSGGFGDMYLKRDPSLFIISTLPSLICCRNHACLASRLTSSLIRIAPWYGVILSGGTTLSVTSVHFCVTEWLRWAIIGFGESSFCCPTASNDISSLI